MNDFVNYKKRGVGLPPGCKNLIDVLNDRPEWLSQEFAERLKQARVTRDESVTGRMSEIPKYVSDIFESRGLACTLEMGLLSKGLTVDIQKMMGERPCASVTFSASSDLDRAFRDFVVHRGLPAIADTPNPPTFYPEVPVQIIYDISPSASSPSVLGALIADVFREVCKLEDDSPIHSHYYEMSDIG